MDVRFMAPTSIFGMVAIVSANIGTSGDDGTDGASGVKAGLVVVVMANGGDVAAASVCSLARGWTGVVSTGGALVASAAAVAPPVVCGPPVDSEA